MRSSGVATVSAFLAVGGSAEFTNPRPQRGSPKAPQIGTSNLPWLPDTRGPPDRRSSGPQAGSGDPWFPFKGKQYAGIHTGAYSMGLLEAKNGNPDQTALQDASAMDSARDFAHGRFVARPVYSSTIRVNGS